MGGYNPSGYGGGGGYMGGGFTSPGVGQSPSVDGKKVKCLGKCVYTFGACLISLF